LTTAVNIGFCDAIVVTNGDNLYAKEFVPAVLEKLVENFHLVGTWFVSRYVNDEYTAAKNKLSGRIGGPTRLGRDYEFNASFNLRGIDLGAAAFRTDAIAKHGVRFVIDRLRKDPKGTSINFVEADGNFFQELKNSPGIFSSIIERSLFVHPEAALSSYKHKLSPPPPHAFAPLQPSDAASVRATSLLAV
jgi:hypothetical protein